MRNILKFRFAGILIMLAMIAVFGAVVMLLWNAIFPELFGFSPFSYLQGVGILVLARILFGGLDFGFAHHGGHANKLREKWMNMNDNERKEFIEKEKAFMGQHNHFSHLHWSFENGKEQKKEEKNE